MDTKLLVNLSLTLIDFSQSELLYLINVALEDLKAIHSVTFQEIVKLKINIVVAEIL